jgi:hypothetical protein
MGWFDSWFTLIHRRREMLTLDPYGSDTLNTAAATYACVECPDKWWCNPPYTPPPGGDETLA